MMRTPPLTTATALPVLASVSGASGIAYELLYVRVLTLALGDTWYTVLAVMLALFGGMAAGAWLGRHRAGWLPVIEASLGLHALAIAAWVAASGAALPAWLPATAVAHPLTVTAVSLVLVGPAALLIGAAVPLFGVWRARLADARPAAAFGAAYLGYNAGAAASLLVVAFVAVPALGIATTLGLLACLNLAGGGLLFLIQRREGDRWADPHTPPFSRAQPAVPWGLVLVSIAGALTQVLLLRVFYAAYTPHPVNYALLLALALLGVALGTTITIAVRPRWYTWLTLTALGCAVTWLALPGLLTLFGAALSPIATVALTILWALLPLTLLGGTVTAWAYAHPDPTAGSRAVAASAIGNAAGFALYIVLSHLTPLAAVAAATVLLVGVVVLHAPHRRLVTAVRGMALLGAAGLVAAAWPADRLHWSSTLLHDPRAHARLADHADTHGYTQWGRHAAVIDTPATDRRPAERRLTIDGYLSLTFPLDNHGRILPRALVVQETLAGALPAALAQGDDRGLVIGLGSGITGNAAQQFIADVTTVDNNPAIEQVLPWFHGLWRPTPADHSNRIVWADGLTHLRNPQTSYDTIIATGTSPTHSGSSRLWTRDAFAAARAALAPGGTFSLWLDTRTPRVDVHRTARALEATFPQCAYMVLTAQYFHAICGDDSALDPSDLNNWPAPLRDRVPGPHDIPIGQRLTSLMTRHVPLATEPRGLKPHTLAHPQLTQPNWFRLADPPTPSDWSLQPSRLIWHAQSPFDHPRAATGLARCPTLTAILPTDTPIPCAPIDAN